MTDVKYQNQFQKHLRDFYNVHVWCRYSEKGYYAMIGTEELEGWHETYEEALEYGLMEASTLPAIDNARIK